MKVPSISWSRVVRALLAAFMLLGALIFVAANFVLVEVRLLGLDFETRLAWAVVVAAALGFAGGVLHARLSGFDPAVKATRQPESDVAEPCTSA